MKAVPNGTSCYICLDKGLDEAGKPLVRNCSCHGNAIDFTHLSCIITHAEQKSAQVADIDVRAFEQPWSACPNCDQSFQNQLAVDIPSVFSSFAKGAYGHPGNSMLDKVRVMTALGSKISAYKI
jgi:hypothetical protein